MPAYWAGLVQMVQVLLEDELILHPRPMLKFAVIAFTIIFFCGNITSVCSLEPQEVVFHMGSQRVGSRLSLKKTVIEGRGS